MYKFLIRQIIPIISIGQRINQGHFHINLFTWRSEELMPTFYYSLSRAIPCVSNNFIHIEHSIFRGRTLSDCVHLRSRQRGRLVGGGFSRSAIKGRKRQSDKRRNDEKIYIREYMEQWNREREALNLKFDYEVARYLLDKTVHVTYISCYFHYISNNLVQRMESSVLLDKYTFYFS
jgi:hypothetical protein